MIDLGSSEFVLHVPALPEPELRTLSTTVFGAWDEYCDQYLSLPDYALHLQIEEGSVKGLGRIGAIAAALYVGIGQYGDFYGGLRVIDAQITASNNFLAAQARRVFSCPEAKAESKRASGATLRLRRIFSQVERREISVDEAMQRAAQLFGDDGASDQQFMDELRRSLDRHPRTLAQNDLPFVDVESDRVVASCESPKPRKPRERPELGPPYQLRVEIWRESKGGRRMTKVTKRPAR